MTPREKLAAASTERDRIAVRLAETRESADALIAEGEALGARAAEMDASATSTNELEAVAVIRREAEAKRRAALLAQAEIPGLERELGAAEVVVTGARLGNYRRNRDEAHAKVLMAVEALGEVLAELLAADLVLDATVGERFTFDPAQHPPAELWRPRPLITRMVGAIPTRFRPDNFGETITRAAEALARKETQNDE